MQKHITILALVAALTLTSCISDDSSEGGIALPTLTVEGSDAETMPVYNIYLGNECVLNPTVSYSGNGTLAYHWQVGTYSNGVKGELQDAGTSPELRYNFTEGGSYYVHLTVTDGSVGKVADYQVNVNRTFEEGYLLSATDADGSGNLTFLKILTPEEEAAGTGEVVMEHALSRMNEGVSEQGLVGVLTCSYSNYPSPDITRLLVSMNDRCYFLNPNELTILSVANYGEVYSGYSATKFFKDAQTPFTYDTTMKRFVHINVKNQFPFEYRYFVDFTPQDIIQCKAKQWSSLVYNNYFMDYDNSAISVFNAYAPYYGLDTYFPSTGDVFSGKQLLTAFSDFSPNSSYVTPWYVLAQTADSVYMYTNNTSSGMSADDFTAQRIANGSDLAVPARGTWMCGSPTYKRMFYAIDNRIYVLLPANAFALPTLSQYAIQVPDGEEVTCMDTNFDTEELYVATYNSSSRRGSFYVYSCADVRTDNAASVQPKKSWKSCTGRVSNLIYKPSIQ